MRYIFGAILLIFLGAIGLFAVQNLGPVSVQFLTWKRDIPFALLAVAIYILGMLSGWSVLGFLRRSLRQISEEPASNRVL